MSTTDQSPYANPSDSASQVIENPPPIAAASSTASDSTAGNRFSQLLSYTGDKLNEFKEKVQNNEKVQEYTKIAGQKTEEVKKFAEVKKEEIKEFGTKKYEKAMENEKIKGAVDYSLEKGQKIKEKTGEVLVKANELKGKIVEKTKERTSLTRERTKALWARGKGKIVRVKNDMKEKWGKSAQETLLAQEESKKKWETMKLRGADDVVVPARQEYTTAYHIEKGTIMRWSFRVKDYDVGFGVRLRLMRDFGGAYEEDVLPVERFDNTDTIEGSWVADADRTIVLVFDNSYSKLRSKTVAYLVGTEKATEQDMLEVAEIEKQQEAEFQLEEKRIKDNHMEKEKAEVQAATAQSQSQGGEEPEAGVRESGGGSEIKEEKGDVGVGSMEEEEGRAVIGD